MKCYMPPGTPFDFCFPEHDFAYFGVPKCGSTSIRDSLGARRPADSRKQALKMKRRFAVIRNPVNRAMSAWANKWPEMDFDEWWDVVREDPYFDLHTTPFTAIIAGANEIRCLEYLKYWWPPSPFTAPHQHKNSSGTALKRGFKIFKDIEEVYSQDLALWKTCRNHEASGALTGAISWH